MPRPAPVISATLPERETTGAMLVGLLARIILPGLYRARL
jgi:hypothetical protein